MWFIFLLSLSYTFSTSQQETCDTEVDGSKVIAITELFRTTTSSDRWTILLTDDMVFTLWNVAYNENNRILEVYNISCDYLDAFIHPDAMKGLHTLFSLENPTERLLLALKFSPESLLKPNYTIFKAVNGVNGTSNAYKYINLPQRFSDNKYKYLETEFDSMGTTALREIRAIANVYNEKEKYLVVYRRQENDLDQETGVNVHVHQNQTIKRVSKSLHRRYSSHCLVFAATGVYASQSDKFYGIEIFENRFVVRQFFVEEVKSSTDCMVGVVMEGSISELVGQHPDPCKGSKLDEIIPFGKWKAVMFGRWMYRTQKGIRIRERLWERMSWYYPLNENAVKYDYNRIQSGTFVDAAFYWKKEEETFIFFLDEYFTMKSIHDQGNDRRKITDKFNIDINLGERITAAFLDDKTDEVYLISGNKFWVIPMAQSNAKQRKSKSTTFLFGKERNVDAVDVDDQYYYFFDGNEHFTFEKNTLQDRVFRSPASVNMKNRDNIFLCYTAKDPFHSKFTKWIIAAQLLLLFFAFLLTCFVFNYPWKNASSFDSALLQSKSAISSVAVPATKSNATKLKKNVKRKH